MDWVEEKLYRFADVVFQKTNPFAMARTKAIWSMKLWHSTCLLKNLFNKDLFSFIKIQVDPCNDKRPLTHCKETGVIIFKANSFTLGFKLYSQRNR
jgi:hypothetical protein